MPTLDEGHARAAMLSASNYSIGLHTWAVSTTRSWSKEVKDETRRKRRLENEVRRQMEKRQELQLLRHEQDSMVLQVERLLAALNNTVTAKTMSEGGVPSPEHTMSGAVCRLALESDTLRSENVELRQKTQLLSQNWSRLHQVLHNFAFFQELQLRSLSLHEASEWISCSERSESGWRVNFSNGEPSFHFHPFTRGEVDAAMACCDVDLAVYSPCAPAVGQMFGWTVYHAPVRRARDNSLVAHARFTTRVRCSLEDADSFMKTKDIRTLPLLIKPPNWSYHQRDSVNTQVLQELDVDTHVMVCNIPSHVHTRYIQLGRRLPGIKASGKRLVSFFLITADSSSNARSRAAEEQHDVQWITEAGTRLALTEVDETTIDVACDHWSSCENELHREQLFVFWAEFACKWTEMATRSTILKVGNKGSTYLHA
ncbi:hypothetical protein PHYPSEUDO_015466 [Phytophthora pseudosyringae]|uniref:Uncharacterized protein n=1 Tax=Phytophthora pseudosyringae TaxID=221518 RepID=A0A8T1V350_9STRA|nr:hypothetical protein PHYPSEUDO_015466 [Phytophthora pseudosyringae]